ncbi:MAG TPA: response regulator [Candidatus Aquilonibacter sp.]|nr:response regulator [Candidatus Aquilonibacter sp.]
MVVSRLFVAQQQTRFVSPRLFHQTQQDVDQHILLRGRILVVDDDDDLRKLLRALLEGDGYQVFSCRDAARALKIFASRGDIDLLLTDFRMPQMTGVELAQEIARARPDLPVLILSGAILPDDALAAIAAHGWDLIAKPCQIPALLQTIAARLQRADRLSAAAKTEACVP